VVTRRRAALALVASSIAAVVGLLLAPLASSAQSDESMLAVRGIDATDARAVALTFLWTGSTEDLKSLTIREDGRSKSVTSVSTLRRTGKRLATLYVVDLSESMGRDGALADVKRGLAATVARLPEGDEVAIVSASDAAVIESGFTDDRSQLDDAIDSMAAPKGGGTALWDGIRKGVKLFATRRELQPNVVVVTDGKDDASHSTLAAARADVIASGAAFFSIELDHDGGTDSGSLATIMDRTGGRAFPAPTGKGTVSAFGELGAALASQYVATYASAASQGQIAVSVGVGGVERQASYVAGARVEGAAVAKVELPPKAFGPAFLRGKAGGALALVLVGLAAGLGAFAVASLATATDESLNAVLRPYDEGGVPAVEHDSALAQTALMQRVVELTEEFAERQGILIKVERLLERADLPLRAAEALFFYAAGATMLVLLAFTLGGFMGGLILGLLAVLVPPAVIKFLAARRAKKFQGQLPDTLSLLSGSLRAGYSLLQGVEAVSGEVGEPMGKELRRVITEARLGREIEDSMDAVAERMGSPDFAWAVMAVRIQREVGGNLSELLLTVADTMIQRERLRRDVAALTAEGKISAIILGLLPIGLGAFMWLSNPEYMSPLGSTGLGKVLLGVATASGLAGFAWMKKIINIEI
jgi:tight adherence protein B